MSSSVRLATRLRSTTSQKLPIARGASCLDAIAPSGVQPCKRRFSDIATGFRIEPPPLTAFTPSSPSQKPEGYNQKDYKPNDERTLKLGKTLRTLQPLLPTLLQTPLPSSILSPQISLHLFPSTHPHLPVVHGRVAYVAALWTSPLAWGRVPLVGNVKLEILSERMVKSPMPDLPESAANDEATTHEQLVVRWKTIEKPTGTSLLASAAKLAGRSSDQNGQMVETTGEGKEFTGLFIFAFDEEGRIVRHVIEHVQEHGNWEKGVGARVVGLTDWLLRRVGRQSEPDVSPCFVGVKEK